MKKRVTYHIQALGGIILLVLALGFVTSCSDTLLDEEGKDVLEVNSPFEWTRSTDKSTRLAFLRNYGVGYSYNAVEGEYCNWKDIRCQVINRQVLEWVESDHSQQLYTNANTEMVSYSSRYTYNKRDYVAGIQLDTKSAVDLGLYNKTKRTRHDVLEDGVQEKFYYSVDYSLTKGSQSIDAVNLLAFVRGGEYENLLTLSFRNAVEHMSHAVYDEKHDELYLTAMVDSFIKVYGTHVITSATLGGRLHLDLAHDMWRYNDQVQEKQWTTEQILWSYSHREESRKDSIYKFIQNTSINVTAYGGDQSYLQGFLGETRYDGTRTFHADSAVENWSKSVKFDTNDEKNSNVELIDMKVTPIWKFIAALDPGGDVVSRVQAEIMQDITYQQQLLESSNLFNTSFSLNVDDLQVKIRVGASKYEKVPTPYISHEISKVPHAVNIVSGGRYVATICKEEIDSTLYTTVYPIYNGKLAYQDGLAFNGDKVYRLKWSYGFNKYLLQTMDKAEMPQKEIIYINDGALSLVKQDDLTYTESHPMLYLELEGGVQYDGSFKWTSMYLPEKRGKEFIIPDVWLNLIGWDWDADRKLMVRNDSTYTYIYNPTEMDYVE